MAVSGVVLCYSCSLFFSWYYHSWLILIYGITLVSIAETIETRGTLVSTTCMQHINIIASVIISMIELSYVELSR